MPSDKTRLKLALIVFVIWFIVIGLCNICKAEEPAIWKVLLAEAASEGEIGMRAVCHVIKNRKGNLQGFYGAKRPDLEAFCDRQGKFYIDMAKRIEKEVFESGDPDITCGATHFENVIEYGVPSWAEDMSIVAMIGRHVFYKE